MGIGSVGEVSVAKSPRDTKGPVVKTGPTRGQNRSRNDDGRWRGKRSDAGKTRDKGKGDSGGGNKRGCFITTALCEMRGLPDDCRELTVLRGYRDDILLGTPEGRLLVEDYYRIAPGLVPLVREPRVAAKVWDSIQRTISLIEEGKSEDATECYRLLVSDLQR